jgi:hypothetical protein
MCVMLVSIVYAAAKYLSHAQDEEKKKKEKEKENKKGRTNQPNITHIVSMVEMEYCMINMHEADRSCLLLCDPISAGFARAY